MYAFFYVTDVSSCQGNNYFDLIILLVRKQVKGQEAQLYSLTSVPSHRLLKLEGHNLIIQAADYDLAAFCQLLIQMIV